eukprot:4842471-Alexandrium_andersonii.AAC.1
MRACSVRVGVRACGRAGGRASRQAGGSAVMCARGICVCALSSSASWAFSPRASCDPAAARGDLAMAFHAPPL